MSRTERSVPRRPDCSFDSIEFIINKIIRPVDIYLLKHQAFLYSTFPDACTDLKRPQISTIRLAHISISGKWPNSLE